MTVAPVCRVALLLFAAASADAANGPPMMKGGEWQTVQLGDHFMQSNEVGTACFADLPLLAKFNTMPHCSRKEVRTDGDTTTADARCRVLSSIMSFREKIRKLDDNNFYTYTHITYSPPAFHGTELEVAESILFMHLKRLGPCRPGEKPAN